MIVVARRAPVALVSAEKVVFIVVTLRRRRTTLAGQLFALQLAIIVVVLVAVAAVSLSQSAATFERVEGRRVSAIAEQVERIFPGVAAMHLLLDGQMGAVPKPADSGSTPISVWIDPAGQARLQLAATAPTLILVRPDGYIGYRSQPADGAALVAHLGRYLVSRS